MPFAQWKLGRLSKEQELDDRSDIVWEDVRMQPGEESTLMPVDAFPRPYLAFLEGNASAKHNERSRCAFNESTLSCAREKDHC
jgi:hypothetical protein